MEGLLVGHYDSVGLEHVLVHHQASEGGGRLGGEEGGRVVKGGATRSQVGQRKAWAGLGHGGETQGVS